MEFPDELPDMHKRLVDFAATGLRAILEYARTARVGRHGGTDLGDERQLSLISGASG